MRIGWLPDFPSMFFFMNKNRSVAQFSLCCSFKEQESRGCLLIVFPIYRGWKIWCSPDFLPSFHVVVLENKVAALFYCPQNFNEQETNVYPIFMPFFPMVVSKNGVVIRCSFPHYCKVGKLNGHWVVHPSLWWG